MPYILNKARVPILLIITQIRDGRNPNLTRNFFGSRNKETKFRDSCSSLKTSTLFVVTMQLRARD